MIYIQLVNEIGHNYPVKIKTGKGCYIDILPNSGQTLAIQEGQTLKFGRKQRVTK